MLIVNSHTKNGDKKRCTANLEPLHAKKSSAQSCYFSVLNLRKAGGAEAWAKIL